MFLHISYLQIINVFIFFILSLLVLCFNFFFTNSNLHAKRDKYSYIKKIIIFVFFDWDRPLIFSYCILLSSDAAVLSIFYFAVRILSCVALLVIYIAHMSILTSKKITMLVASWAPILLRILSSMFSFRSLLCFKL